MHAGFLSVLASFVLPYDCALLQIAPLVALLAGAERPEVREAAVHLRSVGQAGGEVDPQVAARAALSLYRAVPVSFALAPRSWRRTWNDASGGAVEGAAAKSKRWATLVPGRPETYVFTDEDAYMDDYSSSWLAHTWRKKGYDCNRHVEIIAAGAIPVYRDSKSIPPFTMTLYPKLLMERIEEQHATANKSTLAEWRRSLIAWGRQYLTTPGLVRYMAEAAGLQLPLDGRVLFIDHGLPSYPDYMSMAVLSGLAEVFGPQLDVLYEVSYLYPGQSEVMASGFPVRSAHGYAFNYVGSLPEGLWQQRRNHTAMLAELQAGVYSLVVYGSFLRSRQYWDVVAHTHAGRPERLWLVDGEDAPFYFWHLPYADKATVFVRELAGNLQTGRRTGA